MESVIRDEFMIRFNKGDKDAFNTIFNDFHDKLFYFTKRLTNNEKGEEIMLDTFKLLWFKRENFATYENVKAFLFITARNSCYNFLRNVKVERKRAEEWGYTLNRWEAMDEATGYQAELINELHEQLKIELHEQVRTLPDMVRKVITMAFLEGKSTDEIASILGITASTVRSHRQSGIRMLKNRLSLQKFINLVLSILAVAAAIGNFF